MEHQLRTLHIPDTLLQGRYLIVDLLGQGGFGAVYLARDQQEEGFVALKELRDQSATEKRHLLGECEILMRLEHPSLPRVAGVFEQDARLYMVMEYIAGPNLEILRKQQANQRFTFAAVVTLMQPIIEAISYLHQQEPPLMHRDIKPANIIVPHNGSRAVLVDFGIAKEYYEDATTTALRHCSPGYSAPEQYSSVGTDPRADVYGLGATCYTLLSGTQPVDALQRMIKLANKSADPLSPLAELVVDVPTAAILTVQRALDINYERRFATPQLFWQALTAQTTRPAQTTSDPERTSTTSVQLVLRPQGHKSRQKTPAWLTWSVRLITLLLLAGLVTGLILAFQTTHRPAPRPVAQSTAVHSTPTSPALRDYPLLARTYAGTIDNLLNRTTTDISFTSIQQNTQTITGTFTETQPPTSHAFSGVIDTSKHLLFTVSAPPGGNELFFDGTMRSDGGLVGNYCSIDASSQCVGGEYGVWDVVPTK